MHEKRKCCHCGRKPDSSSALYRFPKPGVTNRQRSEEWAKYCFPEQNCSSAQFQRELYSSHKMCSRHFRRGAFLDLSNKRIHKNAFPENEEHLVFSPSDNGHSYCKIQRQNSYLEPMPGPSISTDPCEQPAAPKVFSPCDGPCVLLMAHRQLHTAAIGDPAMVVEMVIVNDFDNDHHEHWTPASF